MSLAVPVTPVRGSGGVARPSVSATVARIVVSRVTVSPLAGEVKLMSVAEPPVLLPEVRKLTLTVVETDATGYFSTTPNEVHVNVTTLDKDYEVDFGDAPEGSNFASFFGIFGGGAKNKNKRKYRNDDIFRPFI